MKSIINLGGLSSTFNQRKHDMGYISFELNPPSNELCRIYPYLKNCDPEDLVELIFDKDKLLNDGFSILDTIPGKEMTKTELGYYNCDLSLIGEYAFIESFVPLTYLTEESRKSLAKTYTLY